MMYIKSIDISGISINQLTGGSSILIIFMFHSGSNWEIKNVYSSHILYSGNFMEISSQFMFLDPSINTAQLWHIYDLSFSTISNI